MKTKRKPRVPKSADDKEQSKAFIDTARKLETDESGETLEKVFRKIVPPKKTKETRGKP
jgi:hypothetical protein